MRPSAFVPSSRPSSARAGTGVPSHGPSSGSPLGVFATARISGRTASLCQLPPRSWTPSSLADAKHGKHVWVDGASRRFERTHRVRRARCEGVAGVRRRSPRASDVAQRAGKERTAEPGTSWKREQTHARTSRRAAGGRRPPIAPNDSRHGFLFPPRHVPDGFVGLDDEGAPIGKVVPARIGIFFNLKTFWLSFFARLPGWSFQLLYIFRALSSVFPSYHYFLLLSVWGQLIIFFIFIFYV